MGKAMLQAALAIVPISAAAVAAAVGAWWVVAFMLLLAVIGGASQSRWVQRRVPVLRTPAQRLSAIYESGYRLRSELKRQARHGELEGWHTWGGRVAEWDATIWTELKRTRDDWLPLQRTLHDLLYKETGNWVDVTLKRMDERLALLHRLMDE